MPISKQIESRVSEDLFSVQVFDSVPAINETFHTVKFIKWAAVEVSEFNKLPPEIEKLIVPGGLYAVFIHKGGPVKGREMFTYIFTQWLPESGFSLDNRPHFEILGEKYKNNDPDSEEEIWIPLKPNK